METAATYTTTDNAITAATVYAFGYSQPEAYDRALTKLMRHARTTGKVASVERYEASVSREINDSSREYRFDFS